MQQRQYRPGDALDDYCPRERRITDHAIVAMVDGEIQRTRCAVCEAEHEFKNARVPSPRKKSTTAALFSQVLDTMETPPGRIAAPAAAVPAAADTAIAPPAAPVPSNAPESDPVEAADLEAPVPEPASDDRPFRRSLIRAQLPRPEGQTPPQRAIPEFTMHQPLNQRPARGARFHRRPGGGTAADFNGGARHGRPGGNPHGNANGNGPGGQGSGRRRRRKKH